VTRTYRPGWFSRSVDVRELQTDAPAPTVESAGFLEAFGAKWRETFTGEIASELLKPSYAAVPNYSPSRVDVDAVTEGIDEDLWYKYGNARSPDQLYSIYVDNLAKMDRRKTLAGAGWAAIPAAILADTLDPTTLAITALTGGVGSAVGATRALRLSTYAKAGLAAGVPLAFTESYRASVNPDIKPTDVVLAGLGGAGAGVGATVAGAKGMGVVGSALTVGSASAAPVAALVPFTEQDDRDAVIGISSAFLLGAVAGGVSPALRAKMEPAMRWTLESEQVAEIGVNNLTPKGRKAFPMALDERANVQRETRAIESVTSLDANPETYVASMQSANTANPANDPAGVSTAVPGNGPTAIKVYRGDMVALDGGKHLSGQRSVDEVLRPDAERPPTAPFKFYTTDPGDAARYAMSDSRTVAKYEKRHPGQGAELFKTIHGHDPRPDGSTQSFDIAPKKTLDLTAMGTRGNFATLTEAINNAMGFPPLPTNWRNNDVPNAVQEALDGPLRGARSNIGGDADPESPVWRILRNEARTLDVWFSKQSKESGNYRPLEPEQLSGSNLAAWMESMGFDSVAYMHDTPNGPVKHYAMIEKAANTPDPRALNEAISAEAERIAPIQSAMGSAAANELRATGNTARLESLKIGDFDPSFIDDSKPWAGGVRRWTTLQAINVTVSNADNPIVRRAGNMLAFDGIAKKNGRIYEAADQWANARSEAMVAPLFYQLEKAYKSHRSGGGELAYAEFREAVTKAKRRGGVGYESVPGVNEGMKATIGTFNEAFDVMARHNVRGADDFNRLDNYVTRRWRRDAIEAATQRDVTANGRTTKLGNSGVMEALAAAIAKENDWANEKQLAAMARSIFVNGGRRGQHRASLGFLEGSIDEIVADLVDSGTPQDVAESIGERLRKQAQPKGDAKNPPILKHRIRLDETYQHPLADGSVLSIEDLLENDIALIAKGYVRRAHGNAVAAQVLRSMSDDPNAPLSGFDTLASRVREKGREMGQDDSAIDWDIARLETAWRNAVGIPQQTDTKWVRTTRAARIMRNGLRTTMLGNFYNRVQNAVEPLSAIAPDVGKVVTRYMDVLPDFTARAVDGKLSNANLRIYEYMSGRGVSNLVDGTHVSAPTLDGGVDRVLSSIEAKADRWTYMVDKYTGQTMTNDFGYRVVGDVNIHQVVEWATSGKRPPATQMRAFGFTDEIWDRIAAQINEHKVAVPGPETNGKVKLWDANIEKWQDLEAFSAFSAGVNAVTRSWFVNPTGNELPWLVNNELGKALTQFRTFSLASSDAKIAKSIQTRDPKTIVRFAAGTGLMYVAYTMKVYVDSLGRPDAEEFRRERLDPQKAWTIAVSRSAYSSLIPAAIDTARAIVREDPLFAAGRASNIKGGGVTSIPLVDWFNNTLDAGGGVIRATYDDEYDFSMQNLTALRRSALFLPQVEPLVKGIEYLGRDVLNLPEKSRE
jgi:hypothetical protein